jgi:hypothetical protein
MISNKAVYITFDFGLKGDYTGLFTWLDNHNAVECGNGVAFLKFETKSKNYNDIFKELNNELSKAVKLSNSDRIYAIVKDETSNLVKGRFIVGGRRQAPWIGYGRTGANEFADSE